MTQDTKLKVAGGLDHSCPWPVFETFSVGHVWICAECGTEWIATSRPRGKSLDPNLIHMQHGCNLRNESFATRFDLERRVEFCDIGRSTRWTESGAASRARRTKGVAL